MRLKPWIHFVLLTGMLATLPACSYITSLFPDKQKQYRYSAEMPDLEIPPDLSVKTDKSSQTGRSQVSRAVASPDTASSYGKAKSSVSSETASRPSKRRKPTKHSDSSVALAESTDNVAMIEMQEPYDEAWNDVNRALGRLKIEITDQNRSDGMYYVYFGGEKPKNPEEVGFWDKMTGFFTGEKDTAKEFRIKLDEKGDLTYIRILDQNDQAVTDGPGLDLLKRLHRKLITLDQPEPEGEETRRAEESEKK